MRVRGAAILPPSLVGRFGILLAVLRQMALVFSTAIFSSEIRQLDPDVLIVDQLSACVPMFRVLHPRAKILFYGHFPDRLLARPDGGLLGMIKKLYRLPFDQLERWSTACADEIVVNSKYTRSVFRSIFPGLRSRELKVIYPCVADTLREAVDGPRPIWCDRKILLSINRYEGKKDLHLAIHAFAGLSEQERGRARLVVAGGYDHRVTENAKTLEYLQRIADLHQLSHATLSESEFDLSMNGSEIIFLLSISDSMKRRLLQSASLLIYTPKNEHFGIVPLEAMVAEVPVLATDTGGPLETIYDGRTGWLRSPNNIGSWTDIMRKPLLPSNTDSLKVMGQRGRDRVISDFSHARMGSALDERLHDLCSSEAASRPRLVSPWLFAALCVVILAATSSLIFGFGMSIAKRFVAASGHVSGQGEEADCATRSKALWR